MTTTRTTTSAILELGPDTDRAAECTAATDTKRLVRRKLQSLLLWSCGRCVFRAPQNQYYFSQPTSYAIALRWYYKGMGLRMRIT
jgi:hypothetical protein